MEKLRRAFSASAEVFRRYKKLIIPSAAVVVTLAVGAFVLGHVSSAVAENVSEELAMSVMSDRTALYADAVSRNISDAREKLDIIAHCMDADELGDEDSIREYASGLAESAGFVFLGLIDSDGVCHSSEGAFHCGGVLDSAAEAMSGRKAIAWGEPLDSRLSWDDTAYIYAPVGDGASLMYGTLSCVVACVPISELCGSGDATSCVVRSDGFILLPPDDGNEYGSSLLSMAEERDILAEALKHGGTLRLDLRGRDVYVCSCPVEGTELAAASVTESSDADNGLIRLGNRLGIIFVTVLIICAAVMLTAISLYLRKERRDRMIDDALKEDEND